MSSFQLVGLDPSPFVPLFALTNAQLRRRGAMRLVADSEVGFPCRISLEDAHIGDELLLLPYRHQPAASPYRASGPVFVRRHAQRCALAAGEVPPYVTRRLISLRAYDAADRMVDARVCDGTAVAGQIGEAFGDPRVRYIHLHNAKPGCFSCRVNRA